MKNRLKAVVQARMGSSRLKNKTMRPLKGICMIEHLFRRISACPVIDEIILATSEKKENDELAAHLLSRGFKVIRGDENDVLSRYIEAEKKFPTQYTFRITGDNPLIAFEYLEELALFAETENLDYTSLACLPLGMGFELYKSEILLSFEKLNLEWYCREHVTPYFYENPQKFAIKNFFVDDLPRINARLTVDTEEDFNLINKIYEDLYENDKPIPTEKILKYCIENPDLLLQNTHIEQKKYNEK